MGEGVTLRAQIDNRTTAGQPMTLGAKADWLICKEVCIPGGASLSLDVPTGPAARPDPTWGPRIDTVRSTLPQPLAGWTIRAAPTDRNIVIDVTPPAGTPAPTRIDFIPETPDGLSPCLIPGSRSRRGNGAVSAMQPPLRAMTRRPAPR